MNPTPCFRRALGALLIVLGTPFAAAGELHLVDASGAADFADLQPAIDAAAPGDLVLVRAGAYGGFTAMRGVVVAAEAGAFVTIEGTSRVLGLGAGETLVLSGLVLSGGPALLLEDTAGSVVLDGCELIGVAQVFGTAAHALEARAARSLLVVHSHLRIASWGERAHALLAHHSRLFLWSSSLRGGPGWHAADGSGQLGGAGLALEGGELFASGSSFHGGRGGDGVELFAQAACSPGGPGGAGLELGPGGPGFARVQDCAFTGGPGGSASGAGCSDGRDAPGVIEAGGALVRLPGSARELAVAGPVGFGGLVPLRLAGEPGERALVVASPRLAPASAALVLDRAQATPLVAGRLDASGHWQPVVATPLLSDAAFELLFFQALHGPRRPGDRPIAGPPRVVLVVGIPH